jgi:hypothetical protein
VEALAKNGFFPESRPARKKFPRHNLISKLDWLKAGMVSVSEKNTGGRDRP